MDTKEEINDVKNKLLDILSELKSSEIYCIEKWICSGSYKNDLEMKKLLVKATKPLISIADSLKKLVPFEAEMPTENIIPPTIGDQADCNVTNTCHVDEFLYDDNQVDKLLKNGKLTKYYCMDCGSRNIKELMFVSHSMSKQVLLYIFKVLLMEDLHGKQILDVGSRLGAVLYGAYYYSNISKIIGIEMNKECCEIQEQIIKQFSLDTSRIEIVNSDVMNEKKIVKCSDIIVINVLDFFVDVEKHKAIWIFLKENMKKGAYLISNRSMAETLTSLDIFEEFADWLNIVKPYQPENEIFFDVEDCSEIYFYTIK